MTRTIIGFLIGTVIGFGLGWVGCAIFSINYMTREGDRHD